MLVQSQYRRSAERLCDRTWTQWRRHHTLHSAVRPTWDFIAIFTELPALRVSHQLHTFCLKSVQDHCTWVFRLKQWKQMVMKSLCSLKPRITGFCVACLPRVLNIRVFSKKKLEKIGYSFTFKNSSQRLLLNKLTPVDPRGLTPCWRTHWSWLFGCKTKNDEVE